ncbi:PAS domain S-box protein [Candidatus Sulfobium mesophilum]|uniref:PAS domain S-box protein n=1 Tax=Candidatus Sulfobium mesophilum TaxID=2016548 RepID=A0A2U3QG80_9BACT|nr:PAS domain S-box protein [Candidatus Sulfobium mesophilum]
MDKLEEFLKDPHFLIDIFENMRDGLMVVDTEGNIRVFNKTAEEITGYKREEIIGKPCTVLDSDTCVVVAEAGTQGKCDVFNCGFMRNKKCRMRSVDGRPVYVLKNAVVLRDGSGEIVGAVESLTDITSLFMKELELEDLKKELREQYWFKGLLGKSAPMQKLYAQIRNAAESEAPVLIYGESGSGKNLVARAIHSLSRRKEGPYMQVGCGSLNDQLLESELFGHKKGSFTGAVSDRKGRFEAANRGSIFLDEIGDMPMVMQVKLLRVLEEKVLERVGEQNPIQVDIRLISATNKDLSKLVSAGNFREDLFYRVNSITLRVPPLRERVEDIPLIALHYVKKIAVVNNKEVKRISHDAMAIMGNYKWPGNVRQLINALEYCAVTCKGDTIEVSDLPDYLLHNDRAVANEKHVGREELFLALSQNKGNKTLTAKQLGISRVTLWKRLKESGME